MMAEVAIPEWRMGAKAGVSLAAARRGAKTESGERRAESGEPRMLRYVRPEAQVRWLLPSVGAMTPGFIEAILRGAMVGNHVMQWQLFDLMEDTWPRLVKNLNEIKGAAIAELRDRWWMKPWSEKDEAAPAEAETRARLCEEAIFEMKGDGAKNELGYEDTLYDVFDAWAKGVSVLELQWEVRESGTLGMITAPRSSYWVHPKNYGWDGKGEMGLIIEERRAESGERGNRNGPWLKTDEQMRYGRTNDLVEMPADQFLVAIRRARTGHPLAGALLRPLAWWWCAANFSADWLLNLAQIFGVPLRWATHVPGAEQETIDKICEMLANMGSAGWALFPAGTNLELKEPTGGAREFPQSHMLDRADTCCDLLLLGQTLTTQVRREGGARALGEVHQDVRRDVVKAVAAFGARVVNEQLVPAVLRLNYGDDGMRPGLAPKDEEDGEELKRVAETLEVAVRTGIPVPVDWALERLNIPAVSEGEEILGTESGERRGESGEDGEGESGALRARDAASEKLVGNVMEGLTGVEARWLGGVRPLFRRLVMQARSGRVGDEEFVRVLEEAGRELPELFGKLDKRAVAVALEGAMGAAVVNGATGKRRAENGERRTGRKF